jgi:hypothetical protein
MKILLVILTTMSVTIYGQKFSYHMFFTDAVGNKDTITLGYDTSATFGIDSVYGEINIISVPLDTGLDVRITDEWRKRLSNGTPGTFHTKKQISFYDCIFSYSHIQSLDIYTKHWPVTATWDNTLFNDICRKGSVFTSINPGTWWDVSSPSNLWQKILLNHNSATFTTNTPNNLNYNYGYVNKAGDKIPVFWHTFAHTTSSTEEDIELITNNDPIAIFPNPTSDIISLAIDKSFGEINRVEIYNTSSQVVLISDRNYNISIAELQSGMYIIKVKNNNGLTAMRKFLKI